MAILSATTTFLKIPDKSSCKAEVTSEREIVRGRLARCWNPAKLIVSLRG